MRVLGCIFPKHPEDPAHLDASSSIRELASHARGEVQVRGESMHAVFAVPVTGMATSESSIKDGGSMR